MLIYLKLTSVESLCPVKVKNNERICSLFSIITVETEIYIAVMS